MEDVVRADAVQIERELLERWSDYLPADAERSRALIACHVLANQSYNFDQLDSTDVLEAIAGDRWKRRLLRGLGHALVRSELHDLVAIQPASGPVHLVHHLRRLPADEHGVIPWKPESEDAYTKPQPVGRLFELPNESIWGDSCSTPAAEYIFEAALRKIALYIVPLGLNTCADHEPGVVDRLASVVRGCPVARERQRVFERSGWYPNVIVGHPDRALARHDARYLGWPELPKDRLLLMHRTKSGVFGSIVWCPFVFQFHGHPRIDPTTFERCPDGVVILIRHTIKITNPDSIAVVRLEG
jgi:hypothetical protein